MGTTLPTLDARAARGMGSRAPVRTLWVWRSANRKVGEAAATYRTQASCPTSCAARTILPEEAAALGVEERRGYCYAEYGAPAPFSHAIRGAEGAGIPPDAAARLAHGSVVRFNVSGDFLDAQGAPDAAYIAAARALCEDRPASCVACAEDPAARHIIPIAYTHGWRVIPRDMFGPLLAPRASCDAPEDIEEARARGYAAAIVIPQDASARAYGEAIGERVALCAAQGPRALTCVECRACARPAPAPTIAFQAHGSARARVRA